MFSAYSSAAVKARVQARTLQAHRNRGISIQEHENSLLNDPELDVTPSFQTEKGTTAAPEQKIYHVRFDCDDKTLVLRVKLHRDETQPPSIKLAGGVLKAKHLCLDPRTLKVNGYMPITCVSKWMDSHVKLNQAVHEIIEEFKKRPPVIIAVNEKEMLSFSHLHKHPPVPIAPPMVVAEDEEHKHQERENVVDQIVKLADLFQQGILTEDEFKEAKAKLILKM